MKFEDIIHDEFILKAIADLGFDTPTPIQEECTPPALEGHDLIGQAKTGSGKTFAFGIPILHELEPGKGVQALILAPTRELCQQIAGELIKLAKYSKAKVTMVYGGVSINPQIMELQRTDIVVATPGRLLDHLERNTVDISHAKKLILDEADRMLDMGFIEDIERIIKATPDDKQFLLFSATMPQPIKELARKYLNNPTHIKTSSHVEQELLPQCYYVVDHRQKFSLLVHLIKEENPDKALIFCGTRRNAEAVARNLNRHGVRADELHGGLTQQKRDQVMERFRKSPEHLLVATDVAARGLDISNIRIVFNYDIPQNAEDYTHRIGRTARAGKKGKAISLLADRDFEFFQAILDIVHVHPEKLETPEIRNVGFRKYADNDPRQGSFRGGPRGGSRGPPRSGPRRSSPRSSGRQKKREEKGGWKQSMRR